MPPQSSLAFAYLFGAGLSAVFGYLGGHTSDRIGRRPMILIGEGCMSSSRSGCSSWATT